LVERRDALLEELRSLGGEIARLADQYGNGGDEPEPEPEAQAPRDETVVFDGEATEIVPLDQPAESDEDTPQPTVAVE
jgi:hypothetical protein